jgi:hypothetical protein
MARPAQDAVSSWPRARITRSVRLYEDEKIRHAFWHYLETRAEALVKTHWEEIERLARALHKQQTLDEDAIKRATLSPKELAMLAAGTASAGAFAFSALAFAR